MTISISRVIRASQELSELLQYNSSTTAPGTPKPEIPYPAPPVLIFAASYTHTSLLLLHSSPEFAILFNLR
ncbi:hypothetical protein SK128_011818 [Halocaridina rubra]|uniref:Uncharacterized protein n=1 Tax=Halocaridina rubra TaxID=373956 RepID=A0AAN9A6F5_HALRR